MILLRKKLNNGYFDFEQILANGYKIREDNDRITQKFVNGNRKQILSDYVDVEIEITLGTEDINTTYDYLEQLTSGEYQYYSIKYKQMKSANFIIEEKPTNTIERAASNIIVSDFTIKLLKSSDVVESL